MCQFHNCKTETRASGFCTVCGKEICSDCADPENPEKHASCTLYFGCSPLGKPPFDTTYFPVGPIPEDPGIPQ